MSNIDSLIQGFAGALTLNNLMFGLLGTILGTLVGVCACGARPGS